MDDRITDLEIRLTHQDAVMEELTRAQLAQEKQIEKLNREIAQLRAMIKEVSVSHVAPESEETPPPHY